MTDFFSRYAHWIQPEPNTGCWFWLGSATGGRKSAGVGYGWLRRDNRMIYAHRTAYEAVHGDGSANGYMVRHTCDVPLCVNPDHLLIGTNADNMRDMRERGRSNRGERNGAAKITERQACAIRHLRDSGIRQRDVAARFGVHQSLVSLIWSGRRWAG